MRLKNLVIGLVSMTACISASTVSGPITLTGTEPLTSTVRVSRSGIPSVFGTPKPFPGTTGCTGGTCYFQTVTLIPGADQFVQVAISGSLNVFTVAYLDSFNVADLSANYLGDAGSSGLSTFYVFVPTGHNLVLAFNSIGNAFGTVHWSVDEEPTLTAPTLTKSFGTANINLRDTTPLTFTVTDPNPIDLTGVSFTDTLPAGLLVDTLGVVGGSCPGNVTAAPGTNTITVSGVVVSGSTSCTIIVQVVATASGVLATPLTNTTSSIFADGGLTGSPATATINATDLLFFLWFFLES